MERVSVDPLSHSEPVDRRREKEPGERTGRGSRSLALGGCRCLFRCGWNLILPEALTNYYNKLLIPARGPAAEAVGWLRTHVRLRPLSRGAESAPNGDERTKLRGTRFGEERTRFGR